MDYKGAAQFLKEFHLDLHRSKSFRLDVIDEALDATFEGSANKPRRSALRKERASTCLSSLVSKEEPDEESSTTNAADRMIHTNEEWGHFIVYKDTVSPSNQRKRSRTIVWKQPKRSRSAMTQATP